MSIALGIASDLTSYSLMEVSDATVILIPGAALLLIAATVRFTERRLSGPAGRPHSFEAEPDDVVSWYSNLPEEHRQSPAVPTDRRIANVKWGSRLTQGFISLALVFLVLDLLVAGLAAFSAAKFTERYGPRTVSLVATLERINNDDPIGTARSTWTRYLPSVGAQHETANAWLEPLITASTEPTGLGEYRSRLLDFFSDDQGYLNVFRRAVRGTIPSDTLALLERIASHPRTVLFRRMARARFSDVRQALIASRVEDPVVPSSADGLIVEAARANALAAILDVAQQRSESALERLGENVAVGEHLLRMPDLTLNRSALNLLAGQALLPLAAIERTRERLEESAQLSNAAQQIHISASLGGVAGLTVDTDDLQAFQAAISNPRVPLGYRARWLEESWTGLCAHSREIVIGPSAERRASLQSVAESLDDSSHAIRLLQRSEKLWQYPVTTATSQGESTKLMTRLSEKLFLGALYRLVRCTTTARE
jgi:hypothetical protein